jgi:hypothetical protein
MLKNVTEIIVAWNTGAVKLPVRPDAFNVKIKGRFNVSNLKL